jgi:hypothetical protein
LYTSQQAGLICVSLSTLGLANPSRLVYRKKWEDWMTDKEGIEDGDAKEPSCKVVAKWLVETYTTMPETIGRNAWMKNGFQWF